MAEPVLSRLVLQRFRSLPAEQVDKEAHLPELRFALGEPEVDTTTIDNAAASLEKSGFFIRRVGTDG